ncbi:class I SAM-dependent methyltransferase [Streptomyces sp. NPDC017936]|uniref:class I SAM-dependent methyltransferase n=1 Tax=Streptomyces sp. NPDC017936 TaxID=3365016 RepID=UPI0037B2D956
MSEQRFDVWASGNAYERYMGRWSRLVAKAFVSWLGCSADLRWLDVGCGTGALTTVVSSRCRPRAVLGIDRSEAFVGAAAAAAPASARFAVGDAVTLPVRDAACDVAVSALTLNFLPEPGRAVDEMVRSVRPGGLVAAYVWDYAGEMALLRRFWDAASSVDPAAAARDEGRRFPVCRPEPLRTLWADSGLLDVAVTSFEVPTVFADFDDLWQPFMAGQGPAPGYVAALSPNEREELRSALGATVPTAADGSITLTARSWAVSGSTPGGPTCRGGLGGGPRDAPGEGARPDRLEPP